jgi:hypothetical protein
VDQVKVMEFQMGISQDLSEDQFFAFVLAVQDCD